jgi:hypothetical protein
MANLIRCKACGYVTKEGNIKDICPACGVPAKMFEAYSDPVSEKRRKILDLHIHPILIHFPQAFAFSLFILAVLSFLVPTDIEKDFVGAIKVIAAFLPLVVLLSFFSGLLDGKTRFRKVTTPLLMNKIIFGLSFFGISVFMAIFALFQPLSQYPSLIIFTIVSLLAVGTSIPLGIIGASLIEAKFPG